MKVITNERPIPWDVDGTLIEHIRQTATYDHPEELVWVKDTVRGKTVAVKRMEANIRLLEEEFSRGAYVIVWSRSGNQWAKEVIKALRLTKKVHLVLTKPIVYVDDLPVEEWMTTRVFLPQGTLYKK